jgi:hypothetical protein
MEKYLMDKKLTEIYHIVCVCERERERKIKIEDFTSITVLDK